MKVKIYIRVDASSKIGMGHMIRCIALSHMLIKDFEISFVCKSIPEETSHSLSKLNISVLKINNESEILKFLDAGKIVVIDHYNLGADYQRLLKKQGVKVVCIDDLHDKEFYADLIINHAPGITVNNYKAAEFTQFALGPNYVLLRPSFLKNVGKSTPSKNIKNYFVCFGGSDPENLTLKCVNLLLKKKRAKRIFAVIGPLNNALEPLQKLASEENKLNVLSNLTEVEMLSVMQQSDVAIVPASGILLEAISTGCKIISGMYVPNQKFIYTHFKDAGLFVDAGTFKITDIEKAIFNIQSDYIVPNIFDGKSGIRLRKIFQNLSLEDCFTLRRATRTDLDITYKWAINKVIRKYAYNSEIIQYREHQSWFVSRISSQDHVYLIAEINSKVVGSLRFDINDNEAIINYLIDPEFHGLGYGLILLKKGLNKLVELKIPGIEKVVGFVMEKNIASVKVFHQLGYKVDEKKDQSYKFSKKI
jgi:UDP-2,4-diacetamido-2,4,6-trideoxy-beta-L-altropyranose hydrolase